MTYEEFLKDVDNGVSIMMKKTPSLRYGQAVFNYVDLNYEDTARRVQFEEGIDCFYKDNMVKEFLDHCWEIVHTMLYHSKGLTEWPTIEDNKEDTDLDKFVNFFKIQCKAYDINLPMRSYDIYGLCQDIIKYFNKEK